MRRIGTALAVAAIIVAAGQAAFAGNFRVSISIGAPVYRQPVVYQPAPRVVYQQAPVVYQQQSVVVYQQAPVVYQQAPAWRYGRTVAYQPAPVVYQPVVLTPPPVVMHAPRHNEYVQQPIVVNPPVCVPPTRALQIQIGRDRDNDDRGSFRHGRYVYQPWRQANGSVTYRRIWQND